MFLVDTDVISALRKPRRAANVVRWLNEQRPNDIHLSVVTVGEIERGIAKQQRSNPDFAADLIHWQEQLLRVYADRILPIDVATARQWGYLTAVIGNESADLLIAATALARGLTVVTGNTKHFEQTGAVVLNPF